MLLYSMWVLSSTHHKRGVDVLLGVMTFDLLFVIHIWAKIAWDTNMVHKLIPQRIWPLPTFLPTSLSQCLRDSFHIAHTHHPLCFTSFWGCDLWQIFYPHLLTQNSFKTKSCMAIYIAYVWNSYKKLLYFTLTSSKGCRPKCAFCVSIKRVGRGIMVVSGLLLFSGGGGGVRFLKIIISQTKHIVLLCVVCLFIWKVVMYCYIVIIDTVILKSYIMYLIIFKV